MKNRLIITLSDLNGAKHYVVHKIIKKLVLWFGFTILLVVFLNFITIYSLNKKVKNYNDLKEKNKIMEVIVSKKAMELESINDKLGEIEELIGLEVVYEKEYTERLDIAKLSLITKNNMLKIIPNGHVVKPFNGISSKFGSRKDPITGVRRNHSGIDYRARIGTTVIAPADGVIEYAGYNNGGFGKMIIVNHNYGFKTVYAHLNDYKVKIGDYVRKGEPIAVTGNTGRSTGPHLHYEVHYLGRKLNPINFISWNLKNYEKIFKEEKKIKWQSLIGVMEEQHQNF